ncbi:hypothetical protein [Neobacillus terrae]|uniref:hypothetical protein n=1 Tax=Neobacillus terrae TaxID=3034837 RepID=UPI001407CC9B|nr:hypothetical protein [Neobacillus terrae]NHM33835.1 hypothetical protein [Neobacillus terrae]
MNKEFIREITNIAIISSIVYYAICLLGRVSEWFALIAVFGVGIGGLIFLLNLFALIFLVFLLKSV